MVILTEGWAQSGFQKSAGVVLPPTPLVVPLTKSLEICFKYKLILQSHIPRFKT